MDKVEYEHMNPISTLDTSNATCAASNRQVSKMMPRPIPNYVFYDKQNAKSIRGGKNPFEKPKEPPKPKKKQEPISPRTAETIAPIRKMTPPSTMAPKTYNHVPSRLLPPPLTRRPPLYVYYYPVFVPQIPYRHGWGYAY